MLSSNPVALPICPEDSALLIIEPLNHTHTTYMTNVFFTRELARFLALGRIFKGANSKCEYNLKISRKGKNYCGSVQPTASEDLLGRVVDAVV